MDKTKQKIQELVPEIMELKFGCQIQHKSGMIETIWRKFPKNPDGSQSLWTDLDHDSLLDDTIIILGRPITLADVLLAINKYDENIGVDIPDKKFEDVMWKWDWDKPYDDQSQETKDFIGEILGVK